MHLQTRGEVGITFQIAAIVEVIDIVDPVAAALPGKRATDRKAVGNLAANAGFDTGGVEPAEGCLQIVGAFLVGTDAVELHNTGGGVAAEERALRPAQDFDAVDVEYGEALQDRVFQNDIVINDADRLRRVEVEVGVAQAADVEAREGAAEGAFDVQAGDAAGKGADVAAACVNRVELFARNNVDGQGNILQIFFAALRGDDDFAQATFFSSGVLRGGGRDEQAGGGNGDGDAGYKGRMDRTHGRLPESQWIGEESMRFRHRYSPHHSSRLRGQPSNAHLQQFLPQLWPICTDVQKLISS